MQRHSRDRSRASGTAGFTLVELLVAITLLGLLSLALAGGLRFGSRAWERVETDSRALEDIMIARTFLADRLERSILPLDVEREDEEEPAFRGSTSALRFVSTMPGRLQTRGFYRIAVGFDQGEAAGALALIWEPLQGGGEDAAGKRLLVTGVRSLKLSYFRRDEEDETGRWLESWDDPEILPDLVRIAVAFDDGDPRRWPPLVVSPRIISIQ